jgi:hypothetical protein
MTAVTATHTPRGGGGQALTPKDKIITNRQERGGSEPKKL